MKRCAALASLSREHHAALVWAKRVQNASAENSVALAGQLVEVFAQQIEPHFRVEETGLLPALQGVGEAALIARTLAEHSSLRAAIARIGEGDREALVPFGAALAAHVRFEERELFAVAEARLGAAVLAAIALQH
ncbi:MAG: hemerythrin domain-containing protein [Propionivibrio sp.]